MLEVAGHLLLNIILQKAPEHLLFRGLLALAFCVCMTYNNYLCVRHEVA